MSTATDHVRSLAVTNPVVLLATVGKEIRSATSQLACVMPLSCSALVYVQWTCTIFINIARLTILRR
jgi:hypothetical protein